MIGVESASGPAAEAGGVRGELRRGRRQRVGAQAAQRRGLGVEAGPARGRRGRVRQPLAQQEALARGWGVLVPGIKVYA